jgi:hypothetical protein
VGSAIILIEAVSFVLKYVFRYYLHYNAAAFIDPVLGAPNYWTMRNWLLMHMTGGVWSVTGLAHVERAGIPPAPLGAPHYSRAMRNP